MEVKPHHRAGADIPARLAGRKPTETAGPDACAPLLDSPTALRFPIGGPPNPTTPPTIKKRLRSIIGHVVG